MNTIKNSNINIILVCVMIFLLISCENFIDLDTPSESDYSSDNLFNTVSQAELATYGVYYTLSTDIYGRRINTVMCADTDVMQVAGKLNSSGRRVLARYTFIDGGGVGNYLYRPFDRLYAGVERANVCIDRIPKMELYQNGNEADQKELKRLYGEALTLRAFFMHDLIKMWGDVPFKTTPSQSGENFFVDRVDRDIIYEQIINDLQLAIDLVPWRSEVAPQARFTKGSVKGLLARIALHAAGYSLRWDLETGGNLGMRTNPDQEKVREYYQIARDQCQDIMNSGEHTLNPDYIDIWKTLCGNNFDTKYGESMFEIGLWNPTGEQLGNGYMGSKIGVPVHKDVYDEFGRGGTEVVIMPTFYASFDSLDVRKSTTVADFEIDKNGMRVLESDVWNYNPGKWRVWWSQSKSPSDYTGINHIVLRYSDILLMFAEADSWLNNGPTPDAIAALKEIRRRAYKGNEHIVDSETYPSDWDGFLETIMQERAWELGTEGLRKWDLIRWNKLGEVLNATKIAWDNYRNDDSIPLYVYYLPVSNPDEENPKVYGNTSSIPEPYNSMGYLRRNFRNGLNATITGYFAAGFEENKDELYPFPIEALNANPALSQHPGFP